MIEAGMLEVVTANWEILRLAAQIASQYNLLPNDAIIAASCKHYNINQILSFDSDFKNIEFLSIVMAKNDLQ